MCFLENVWDEVYQCDQKHCLGVSKPITWLAAQRKAQALHLGKQAFIKENEKKLVWKKSVKSLIYIYIYIYIGKYKV